MGYVVRDGKVVKARKVVSISKRLLLESDKQKEIKARILKRKEILSKKSA
jgi:hypothetical protein